MMSLTMINKASLLAACLLVVPVLVGCTSTESNVFGEDKNAPDEFAVYSRAPLSLPPDFGLRPPKPGVTRPQTLTPRNDAKDALLSNASKRPAKVVGQAPAATEAGQSPGVLVLLENTGANQAVPDIRYLVNSETAAMSGVGDEGFADSILFWRQQTGLRGAIIDPASEERQMRRKAAESDVVDEAPGPTSTIRRGGGGGGGQSRGQEDKSFWEGWFD